MLIRLSIMVAIVFPTFCAAQEYRTAKPLKNAENALDVVYLTHRMTGSWEDRWLKMNVHWPRGLNANERRPCFLFVRCGGYGGGDKDTGFCKQAKERALEKGFVVANMNYILGRDIFPQVFYDFRTAVRYLRANGKKYHIDPDRIGAWGFSAGGWLSSSSTFTEAGDLYTGNRNAISEAWSKNDSRRKKIVTRIMQSRNRNGPSILVPMDDPNPIYGEYSSRIQALQADFTHFENNITSAAPAICTYVGKGGVSKLQGPAKAAGVDFFPLVLIHPKKRYDGARAVHVPPLNMMVPSPDGKGNMELQDRVVAWFKQKLVNDAVTPVPEFRPNQRMFVNKVLVKVITASAKTTVHYTVDGSTPTLKSPVWKGSLLLKKTTVVKAFAIKKGMRHSGIVTVRFVKGDPPPRIITPTKTILRGKVGQPLKVSFATDAKKPVTWNLAAHYRHEKGHRFKGGLKEFGGLSFDPKTATLSGTPTRPFVYTLQTQVGWGRGHRANVKTYVLHITK